MNKDTFIFDCNQARAIEINSLIESIEVASQIKNKDGLIKSLNLLEDKIICAGDINDYMTHTHEFYFITIKGDIIFLKKDFESDFRRNGRYNLEFGRRNTNFEINNMHCAIPDDKCGKNIDPNSMVDFEFDDKSIENLRRVLIYEKSYENYPDTKNKDIIGTISNREGFTFNKVQIERIVRNQILTQIELNKKKLDDDISHMCISMVKEIYELCYTNQIVMEKLPKCLAECLQNNVVNFSGIIFKMDDNETEPQSHDNETELQSHDLNNVQ